MFTSIDKNLTIAAMESAILYALQRANIDSFSVIENRVSELRQKFEVAPESVSDNEIYQLIEIIQKAQIPDFRQSINIIPRADVAYSYIWERILNKPEIFPPDEHRHPWSQITYKPISYPPSVHDHDYASITDKPTTFAPATHAHDYASITDKPTTFEPTTHAHDYASITDKPATFEPATHAHDYASITDKPATFEPATHAHDYASITDKPATFEPATHAHDYASITGKPTTFAPATHAHLTCESFAWTGDGTTTGYRNIPLTGSSPVKAFQILSLTWTPLLWGVNWGTALYTNHDWPFVGTINGVVSYSTIQASLSFDMSKTNAAACLNISGRVYRIVVWY